MRSQAAAASVNYLRSVADRPVGAGCDSASAQQLYRMLDGGLPDEAREGLLVAVPEAHARARGGEALRDGESDAGAAAGHDRGAALQVEGVHPRQHTRELA